MYSLGMRLMQMPVMTLNIDRAVPIGPDHRGLVPTSPEQRPGLLSILPAYRQGLESQAPITDQAKLRASAFKL